MKTVLRLAADVCLVGSGICIGFTIHQKILSKKMDVLRPLLTQAFLDVIDNSFDTGMTKHEVLDGLSENLAFIEQIL